LNRAAFADRPKRVAPVKKGQIRGDAEGYGAKAMIKRHGVIKNANGTKAGTLEDDARVICT
jgi:hypothetical protein